MPKLKKPPKNAYYFFMVERKKEMEAQGTRFPRGMQDVASLVFGEWKVSEVERLVVRLVSPASQSADFEDLPAAEKERYNQLAKEAKEMEKTNFENKFTTSGESYASLNRRRAAEEAEKAELKELFKLIVHTEKPEERIFILMKAISSCEVGFENLNEKKEYYPLELAAAAFSLKEGFICQYWTLINTMSVPCGYASSAKDTAEETSLPQPGSTIFQKEAPEAVDYNKIMSNIRGFVETWCSDYPDGKPMVFATDSNIRVINGSLEWLVKNADEHADLNQQFLRRLKFYSLPALVIELAVLGHEINPAYSSELQQFRLTGSAENLLSNGCYDYKEEITCPYHRKEDYSVKMHFCCKNYILRRIFIILEEFSEVYSCPMTNRHKITSFLKTTMPDHLKQRIVRPNCQAPAVSGSRPSDAKQKPPPRESSHETSVDYRCDQDNNAGREKSGADLVEKASPASMYGSERESSEGKRESVHDVSVPSGRDTPTDFDLCYERRKRKRSSSPVSPSAHLSLEPTKYERRDDSTRSSSAPRRSEPEVVWETEGKNGGSVYKKDEFGSTDSFSQLPRGRGRGFRRDQTDATVSKEELPGFSRPKTPPLSSRPAGRGQRGPAFGNW